MRTEESAGWVVLRVGRAQPALPASDHQKMGRVPHPRYGEGGGPKIALRPESFRKTPVARHVLDMKSPRYDLAGSDVAAPWAHSNSTKEDT